MFKNYEIKIKNNEEVLYLFLDLNTEFASIKKRKKQTIQKEIADYIKNENISFHGKKVILVASGLILSTILLNTKKPNIEYPKYQYSTPITQNIENIPTFEEKTIINEKEDYTPIKNEEIKPTTTNKVETNTKTNTKPTETIKNSTSNSKKKEEIPVKQESVKTENKQIVKVYRQNGSVIELELEEYLIGVVASEMPASFHSEALKAQAVAARTYTLKAIKSNRKLTDTVATQVYQDNEELKVKWGNNFDTYYNKIKDAVNATKGKAIYYNNDLIEAFYFSTSNGYTEDSSYVFATLPYLKSVESPLDKQASSFLRTITLTYEEASKKLNIPLTFESSIIINRNNSSRVDTIFIDTHSFSGVKFRSLLNLRSTDFDFVLNENDITITTRGYGHGVGMSQYGANFYAKAGWNYQDILKHYYTNITIR